MTFAIFHLSKKTLVTGGTKPLRKESQPSIIYESSLMEVQKDFRDLLELLNAHKVEYLIVGAYALPFHGAPATVSGRVEGTVRRHPGLLHRPRTIHIK